jgi:hypothetical protein
MKNVDEIINKMAGEVASLNDDFLTEKEIDITDRFLSDLSSQSNYMDGKQLYIEHPEWAIKSCSGLINGLRSYIDSLKLKIEKRKKIPNWYPQNKRKDNYWK